MGETTTPNKLRGHCISALINLTNPKSCEEEYLTENNFIDPMLSALVVCLSSSTIGVDVQPLCLDLLSCIAQVAGELFSHYYNSFMPGIKNILITSSGNPDLLKLRGRAMECIGLVGDAVGNDVFYNDAIEVMNILLIDLNTSFTNSATSGRDVDNDVAFDYILPACARIAKALGPAFQPYVPAVIQPLIIGASQEITCTIEDANEDDELGEVNKDEETGLESAVVSTMGLKKRVTMNTYAVHQKQESAKILFSFAEALKSTMHTHLIASIEVVINMITDKHSSEVRSSASLALSKLFDAAVDSVSKGLPLSATTTATTATTANTDRNTLNEILNLSLNKLIESLKGENNITARGCSADCLNQILTSCYNSSPENVDGSRNSNNVLIKPDIAVSKAIIIELLNCCQLSVTRRIEKENEFKSNEGLEDEDIEQFETEMEEEEDLLRDIVDSMGVLLKLHSPDNTNTSHNDIMDVFDSHVAPLFAPYLIAPGQPGSKSTDSTCEHFQIVSTCMMDDIIEHGNNNSIKYISNILIQFIYNITNSENSILRQSSTYGIAQIIRLHSDYMLSSAVCNNDIRGVVTPLVNLIQRSDSQDEDNEGCTENAVYALGLLVTMPIFSSAIGSIQAGATSQLTSLWLSNMPLKTDEMNAKQSTFLLVQKLEQLNSNSNPDPNHANNFLGENCINVINILRIYSEILIQNDKIQRGLIHEDDTVMYAANETLTQIVIQLKNLVSGSIQAVSAAIVQQAFASLTEPQQTMLSRSISA